MATAFLARWKRESGVVKAPLDDAAALKRHFNEAFWMPEVGFIAMALDGEKRQVRSIGSNAGHCLATGIVEREHAPAGCWHRTSSAAGACAR